MVEPAHVRLAVLGGDGRYQPQPVPGQEVRIYRARRYGGNGELRRLEQALRGGGIDRLLVLARWNGHSAVGRVLRICRHLRVPFEIVP